MNSESWFAKLKKRKEAKKLEKLKNDFSFLMDTMDSNYAQVIDELKCYERKIGDFLFEFENKIEAISVLGQQSREDHERSFNKIEEATCNIAKNLDEITSIIHEGVSVVRNDISETQGNIKCGNDDIQKKLQLIADQVNCIRKETRSCFDSSKSIIENKTKGILMNVEEVKALMKIVAVNNLLDEI